MTMLGGPEGVAASLEAKEGEPPLAFFSAAAEVRTHNDGRPTTRLTQESWILDDMGSASIKAP